MKKSIFIISLIILILAGGAYYWFFGRTVPSVPGTPAPNSPSFSFNPFNRSSVTPATPSSTATPTPTDTAPSPAPIASDTLPKLRHLSLTPVGGFMASSTASTTIFRYIDRGVGHVFQGSGSTGLITKVSNTTIPRIYESYWNKNMNAAVLRYMKDETGAIANFYGEIRPTVGSSEIAYEIKGKFISTNIKEVAVSPKGDRIFTFSIENDKGVGYISGFDESKKTKVFETPLTQVTVDWPEENTIAITTKASGVSSGFMYLFDIKKGSMKRVLGNIPGLTGKVSSDAKKIIFSSATSRGFTTNIYNSIDGASQELVFRTTAEKCVWSKKYTHDVYCAVPSELPSGLYPDDWYKGNVSFVDQIWHLDTGTGEVHLLANLLTLSSQLIDATDLKLDPKENFLYFINKRDLTLWSFDLTQ